MSRAIFISCGGDIFIASTVIKLLKKYCWDEFDSLYLCYNNSCEIPKEVQAEFLTNHLDDPKIKIVYWPTQIGYGQPITKMLQVCEEDLILLLEDDGFVFTKGMIDFNFNKIEKGSVDAVGSPRFSCGMEIAEALKVKYNLDYSGYGDKGPNFWPNFFFCKKSDLLKTDLNFAPKEFTMGVYYPELDHKMNQTEHGDTFVWTCIQMRHNGVRFGEVPQYHADPYEAENKAKHEGNWRDGRPYWMHGGSLSTSWGHYLKDKMPDTSSEIGQREFETRCAFWLLCSEATPGYDEFKQAYDVAISTLIMKAGLDPERVSQKVQIYKILML